MIIEQIYSNNQSHTAYYIESDGEAAVIDPFIDADLCLKKAKTNKACIKYVFGTHFNANNYDGQFNLAAKTGATVILGPNTKPNFKTRIALDGSVFKLGDIIIKFLQIPGPVSERIAFLLIDKDGHQQAIFQPKE
ncbi:MBL fold metallo-hydrolase [Solitalea koreensis]|uniref:Metallo-beta-lactamase superfamily protein n=1 Tax=Solitalea koreensis TaxID=543615 RepID=A0A521DE81_9SPHI|nr:hypothetical protein [Solitalea koreensis]SMO69905.1 hypothetical protein SAMN06265350_106227 [Solitalea koreensis]